MLNDELLHKWISGELTEAELEIFRQRPEYEELVRVYKHTSDLTPPNFDKDAMLSKILQSAPSKIQSPVNPGRRLFLSWMKYAAAACILLIGGWLVYSYLGKDVTYNIARGKTKEGVLPDNSTFVLNAESTLKYDTWSWKKERSLELTGEAFFTVTPGSKFTVNTPTGSVQVLGTKFDVWSREGALDVKCSHGKVAVLDKDGAFLAELKQYDAIRITPGQSPEKYEIPGEDQATWTQGITKLRKVPLATVLLELERQFDIKIHKDGINTGEVISCNFQHKDLGLALQTALSPLGLKYDIKEKQVYLKNK